MQRRDKQSTKGRGARRAKARKAPIRRLPTTDLQKQIADLTRELKEAREHQMATGEILASLAESAPDAQPVFDAIVRNLQRLLGTRLATVWVLKDGMIHLAAAVQGEFEKLSQYFPRPLDENTTGGRAMMSKRVLQFAPVLGNPAAPPALAALVELRDSTSKAVETLRTACPEDLPSTPVGRLVAMEKRLVAMHTAASTVQPPLQKFYDSLNEEQKARFNVIGSQDQAASPGRRNRQVDLTQLCDAQAIKASNVPSESIARAINPTDAQRAALNSLNEATEKAAEMLKADCPKDDSLTPPGRVALMEKRLSVMLNAIRIVQPELEAFYGLLTDEQKARFNQLSHAEG